MSVNSTVITSNFQPIGNKVFVTGIEKGMNRTSGGIILTDDDMKDHGIRPRWAQIHAVGPLVEDISVGEWVLISHGRWSQRIKMSDGNGNSVDIWQADYPEAILLVSDSDPRSNTAYTLENITGHGHGV